METYFQGEWGSLTKRHFNITPRLGLSRWTISCLALFIMPAAAQQKHLQDSLMEQATNAFSMVSEHPDSAMRLANDAYSYGKKTDNRELMANASNTIGWVYLHKGHLDSAIAALERSKTFYSSLESQENVIKVNMNLAEVHNRQKQYATAIERLQEADSLSNQLKNIPLQTAVKQLLGIVNREAGDQKKAMDYFKQALHGFELQKDYLRYTSTLISMSMLYRNMKQPDSSFAALQKGLQMADQHDLEPYYVAMLHENLAETHFETKQFGDALKHFLRAHTIFTAINHPFGVAYEASYIGKTYTELKQYSLAETYLLQAYRLNDSLQFASHKQDAALNLAELYRQTGQWQKAYDFLQVSARLKDSLDLADQLKTTTEIKEKYETEKKESQINLLHEKNRRTIWLFVASILGVTLIGLLFWLRSYRRRVMEERILNYFATSLYNQNTVEDVFWDIAKNCISRLNFEDCVIYGYDSQRKMMVQKAAYGPKNPSGHVIANLIEIPLGEGIVGTVAATLKPEIIADTRKDTRYIVDDEVRLSEITVPILLDGKLLGIIDSEHSEKGFYTKRHLRLLQKIADTCSKKITKYFVEESLRKQIAGDLHDEMGSALTSININSTIALKEYDNAKTTAYLMRIKQNSMQVMESINDIVWSIDPINDTLGKLTARLGIFAGELFDAAGISYEVDVPAELLDIKLDLTQRKELYLIIKEALTNIAKHSKATKAGVSFEHRDNRLIISITDNGVGIDAEDSQTMGGNGLANMALRAERAQFNLQVQSENKCTAIVVGFSLVT